MRRTSDQFGERVRQLLEEHGPSPGVPMSYRAADRKTGVNYATIGNMATGQVPEMESVVKFAQGFDQDVNEWLALAGYPPVHNTTHRIFDRLDEVSRELGGFAPQWSEIQRLREHPEMLDQYVAAIRQEHQRRQQAG